MEIKDLTPEQKKVAILLDDLASLESYARDLFSFLPLPVCLVSAIGIILEANPALEKISGYRIEEIIGHPLEKFTSQLDAEQLIKKTLEKESLSSQEIILTTKDKRRIYVSASTLLRKNDQGEIIGCFIGFFDLTIVKENEQDLRKSQSALLNILEDVVEEKGKAEEEKNKTAAVITNLTDGLMVFDGQNSLALINPPAEKLLLIKNEEAYGKPLDELASLADNFKPLFEMLGKEIKEIFRQEIVIKDLTLEISSVPIGDPKKKSDSLIIIHDITRDKAIERMKTEFVSVAAHQLRTPLSAVKWSLSLFLSGDLGEITADQKKYIEKSYESNERMIVLINDLLDVARIEEGRYVHKTVPADLVALVKKILDGCRYLATKRQVVLNLKIINEPFPLLAMDEEKIKVVFQNLFENAIKYTLAGGQVTVSLINGIKEVEVQVQDTGVGIPKDQQDRLFGKFFRAANVMRLETDGTGLGLFITKNVIEAHGGRIWAESVEDQGSTFHFTLPRTEAKIKNKY